MASGKNSITKRWIVNTLCVIVVVLLGIMLVALMLFKEQYYEAVRVTLNSRATSMVQSFFDLSGGVSEEDFNLRANEYVESFNDKTIMEVWVIDRNGKVVVSSSGFSVADEKYPDYYEARTSDEGKASWIGRTRSGEHIMALTFMLSGPRGQQRGAVRYIISLQEVDRQLRTIAVLLALLVLIILAFVTISGLYFIRSIVNPVQKITETASKIAEGDLSARIEEREYEDEIGKLCETINNMARELNETNRMKNEFISTISHELRTPLTAIKGWGETLQDTPGQDAALTEKGLEVITKESERLSHLVEELLDFSRIESGNMSMRFDLFDVFSTLEEVVTAFNERSVRENKRLVSHIPEETVMMHGDVNRIKQVFFNVLDNAFKYSEAEGIITVLAAFAEENQVQISISDTGCGIPETDLPHVTEKFYKANMSARGSGIGLAVVSEIVERHQGHLEIQSQQGSGTAVLLTFPVQNTTVHTDISKGE